MSTIATRSPARHEVRGPGLVAAVAVAAVSYVGTVDPNTAGHYPTCPFLALTGHWCPGCGSLRAVHALAHGDLSTALSRNLLTVALVPVLVASWLRWTRRSWSRRPRTTLAHPALVWALLVVVLAFWLLRNLPVGAALAP
jgi:hypothetical protein